MMALVSKASAFIALLGPARALDPLAGMLDNIVVLEMPSGTVVDPRPVADAVIGANIEEPFSEFFSSTTGLPAYSGAFEVVILYSGWKLRQLLLVARRASFSGRPYDVRVDGWTQILLLLLVCLASLTPVHALGGPGQAGCPCINSPYEYYWRLGYWKLPTPTRDSAEPADVFNCASPPFSHNFQPMNSSGQFNPASGKCIMHPGYYAGDGNAPDMFPVFSDYGGSCEKHHEAASSSCYNLTTGQELAPGVRANWCDQEWCYVEPSNCNMADATQTDFLWAASSSSCEGNAESCRLLYSYGTCGGADVFSSSAGNKEDAYVKMKRNFLTLAVQQLMEQPITRINTMLPQLQHGVVSLELSSLRSFLYAQTSDMTTPNALEISMLYIGLEDGLFTGYYSTTAYTERAPSGWAEDLSWSPYSLATVNEVCAASDACQGFGDKTVHASGSCDDSNTSCVDADIRNYYSTSEAADGQPLNFTKWRVYDPRVRPWYIEAVALSNSTGLSQNVNFSSIYSFATTGKLGLSATGTIITNGTIRGVYAIDYELAECAAALSRSLDGEEGAWAYIVERQAPMQGVLVSSTKEARLDVAATGERLHSTNASRVSIRHSAHFLQTFEWPQGSYQEFGAGNYDLSLNSSCTLHSAYSSCNLPEAQQYKPWVDDDPAKKIYSGPAVGSATGGIGMQFGSNITVNGTVCGDAPVVATLTSGLGASSIEMCQEMCSNTSTCAFFNYEHETFEPYEMVTGFYTGLSGELDWLIVAGKEIRCASSEIWTDNSCQTCEAGLQPNTRGDRCIPCPAGYAATNGTCYMCPEGKVPSNGQALCTECPWNQFFQDGSCVDCPFLTTVNRDPLTAAEMPCVCEKGMFDISSSGVRGSFCFDRDFSSNPFEETDAYAHFQADKSKGLSCSTCPSCMDCDTHPGMITITPGWKTINMGVDAHLNISVTTRYQIRAEVSALRCPNPAACLGDRVENGTISSTCATGYTGHLCASCVKGYTFGRDGCEQCSGEAMMAIPIVLSGALVFGVFYVGFERWFTAGGQKYIDLFSETKRVVTPMTKIYVTTAQIVGTIPLTMSMTFPDSMKPFIDFLEVFTFDVFLILRMNCLFGNSYYVKFFSSFAFPGMIIALLYGYSFWRSKSASRVPDVDSMTDRERSNLHDEYVSLATRVKESDSSRRSESEVTAYDIAGCCEDLGIEMTEAEIDEIIIAGDESHNGELSFDEFIHILQLGEGKFPELIEAFDTRRHMQSVNALVSMVVFIIYPSLCTTAFGALRCRQLESDVSVLMEDYSIDCNSLDYQIFFPFALLVTVLIPVGIPVGSFMLLKRHEEKILAHNRDTLKEFDALVGDYEPEYYYWECVEMGRKLMLAGFIMFVEPGTPIQVAVAMAVTFGFFAASVRHTPYSHPAHDVGKAVAEICIFLVLLSMILQKPALVEKDSELLGHATVYTVIVLSCAIVVLTVKAARDILGGMGEETTVDGDIETDKTADTETKTVGAPEILSGAADNVRVQVEDQPNPLAETKSFDSGVNTFETDKKTT